MIELAHEGWTAFEIHGRRHQTGVVLLLDIDREVKAEGPYRLLLSRVRCITHETNHHGPGA